MTMLAGGRRTVPEGSSPAGSGSDTLANPAGGPDARRAWRGSYLRRVVLGDALAAGIAAAVGLWVRFGPLTGGQPTVASSVIAVLLPVAWLVGMLVARAYEERFFWVGAEEFRRVFVAAMMLLAALGTVSWALKLEVARGFVVVVLPLATLLTLGHRYAQRQYVHRCRSRGLFQQTAVLVGHRGGVQALREQMDREAYHGYRVVGCLLPEGVAGGPTFHGLRVLGGFGDVVDVVRRHGVDTVAVLPSPELEGPVLRRLGWDLEDTDAELLLAPAVTDVVGSRVRIRPVSGLPLLHVERPELRGVRRLTKGAVLALLLLLPVLVAIGLAVRLTSSGPVFFRQERVGKDGVTFGMLKFRSMVPGADRMVEELAPGNEGNGVLFKMKADPRVTRVGRVLRRYSLDELPQLLNVVRGEMSLVGPRPPLAREVEQYGYDMHRRFLVKPGITGLWQVSGRSDLSWDDSVRIDVRYVENWSLTLDLMIIWKTAGAVLRGSGAY